jgi:hypothetical protein
VEKPAGRKRNRIAIGGLAAAMAACGLWLAVGAGASGGKSVRDAGYTTPKACSDAYFNTAIVAAPNGTIHRRKATYKFEVYDCTATGVGVVAATVPPPFEDNEFVHYQFFCKRDRAKFRKCSSPKVLRKLRLGKHVFKVRATAESKVEGGFDTVEENPDVDRFRRKP